MTDPRQADIDLILGKRHHKDGDYWATPDGRIYVGNPFSTIGSLLMLHELDVGPEHEAVRGALDLVLEQWRDDGKIELGPRAPLYPCYTAEAARVLARFGYGGDERLQRTAAYFVDEAHEGGGWRCSFSRFEKAPNPECANPGATLYVLDALRLIGSGAGSVSATREDVIDRAVDFLLSHWGTREPLGPCNWGIGSLFMQVEFPFLRYNLFYWVHVLSCYGRARGDARFLEALEALRGKLDDDGRMVVERPHRSLKGLAFCAKGEPSAAATRRFREIEERVAG